MPLFYGISYKKTPCLKRGYFVELWNVLLFFCGAVAQLGEHQAGSLGVVGSIPICSTKIQKAGRNAGFLYFV
jgi:hypothetical protein